MVPIIYSPRYAIDIGLHVFPTRKYRMIHDELERRRSGLPPFRFIEPVPAAWQELALVHTADYLDKIRSGRLSREDVAQLELPWSREMVDGFRLMTGGSILAALIAAGLHRRDSDVTAPPSPGIAIHIGGGLHHAFPNHGEGFCPFNDVAVAVRVLQSRGVRRHAIVDLDVHHGNGTAFLFGGGPRSPVTRSHADTRAHPEPDADGPSFTGSMPSAARVDREENVGDAFTFSMHQQHNYPMWKPQGSLDIGLPDGAHDRTYLTELERALPRVLAHRPECVFYLAGADPYEDDQLGGLRLSKAGLRERDRMVVQTVRAAGLPLVITMAGGYARRVEDTVAIHAATIEEALRAG
jgi:acetoin utilization deacetylase AcuC-like enzyme